VSRPQPVADATHGFERVASEGAVDLVAKPPDVDVDHVRAVVIAEVPRVVEQLETGQHPARLSHQRLEHGELLRGQVDPDPPAAYESPRRIESKIADLENGGTLRLPSSHQGSRPFEGLRDRPRLPYVAGRPAR